MYLPDYRCWCTYQIIGADELSTLRVAFTVHEMSEDDEAPVADQRRHAEHCGYG